MPRTNQHADATLAVVYDETYYKRRQAAQRVLHDHAIAKDWTCEDYVLVALSLGIDESQLEDLGK